MQYLFGCERPSYADKLLILDAPTLKVRRDATDIITTYKILHDRIDIKPLSVSIMTSTLPTQSNGTNLTARRVRTNFIKKSHSFSVQYKWNDQPTNIKNTKSLFTF